MREQENNAALEAARAAVRNETEQRRLEAAIDAMNRAEVQGTETRWSILDEATQINWETFDE